MSLLQKIALHKTRILLNAFALFLFANAVYNNSSSYDPGAEKSQLFTTHLILFNGLYFIGIYLNVLLYIPQLLMRKKKLHYIIVLLLHLLLFGIVLAFYSEYLLRLFPGIQQSYFTALSFGTRMSYGSWASYVISVSATVFLMIFLFSIGYLAQKYFEVNRQKEAIQKQQMTAELSLLKSQINPHFLFNVLNSIYSLSLKKSDQTPVVVLKLSDLLRYMLYETQQEYVPLEKELQMIRDYIDIEQTRISETHDIKVNINTDRNSYYIAPLILIPFIENAVKHGIDSMIEQSFLHIDIQVKEQQLQLLCRNPYKQQQRGKSNGGIGLINVRKRLELIYPGQYQLTIDNHDHIFSVSLLINLAL
jgi:two-component system, LytTR family, sensor kinase